MLLIIPDFRMIPGYSPTGLFQFGNTTSTLPDVQHNIPVLGTGGRILAVW